MMGKILGIKLADGTFYSIMEEGIPKKSLIELTTVQDNQTTVMVDLYRSGTGTMDDAEYVDTLQISELVPHNNGEPNLCLTLQLDENNNLSAEVYDPESGTSSSSNIQLVTRTESERSSIPDFSLAEQSTEETVYDEMAFADDAFPAEFPDTIPEDEAKEILDNDISPLQDIPESEPEEELGLSDDNFFAPDGTEDVPDIEDSIEEPFFEDTSDTLLDLPEIPDFNDSTFGESSEEVITDEIISENTLSENDLYNDEPHYTLDEHVYETALPDFSKFELPDFDEPQNNEFSTDVVSGLFTESDFDDPAFHEQPVQSSSGSPEFGFSDLYDTPYDDFSDEKKKSHNTAAVVTCIICAFICIAAVIFTLFSPLPLDLIKAKDEVQEAPVETVIEPISEVTELPPQPEPKEDIIVISETPAVIPVPPPAPEIKPEPVTYKIRWGDTLWDLADSFYNNPWLYKKIASSNNIKNPDYIISGTTITIPPK